MPKFKSQNFIQGSLILITANVLVKLIGAVFKIPLVGLLHDEGMGYFNSAYSIYSGMFVIATAGLPVALSKMISESASRNNLRETRAIFNLAFYIFVTVGLLGSLTLYIYAEPFTRLLGYHGAESCIRAISPAIFFVSLMSVYRGFFQGLRNMIPTAVSEVVEALGKLIAGYGLAYIMLPKGPAAAAGGAVTGVFIGSFLGFLVLLILYNRYKKQVFLQGAYISGKARGVASLGRELLKTAIPITISASVFTLTNLIDTALIGVRLRGIAGLLEDSPVALYGRYTSQAVTLYNMPPTLVMALALTLVPSISRAYVLKNRGLVKATTEQALKLTILFAMPAAAGLFTLSHPILQLLFLRQDAAPLLATLSPAVLFVCVVLVTNAVLQATGNVMTPVVNILIAGTVKIILNYVLVGIPKVNIQGAPIGTNACYLIYMSLNLAKVLGVTGAHIDKTDFWVKPAVASASMSVASLFLYNSVSRHIGSLDRLDVGLGLGIAIAGGIAVYALMLLAMGGIKYQDIELLPGGKALAYRLKSYNLIK